MRYKIEDWNNRTVFVFRESLMSFEEFSEIIDRMIKPDSKSKVEITSWTESFTFIKNGIEIYFEYFYDDDSPFYSFELFPIGLKNEVSLEKLRLIMNDLNNSQI